MADSNEAVDLARQQTTPKPISTDSKTLPELPQLATPPSTESKPPLISSPAKTFQSRESAFSPWTPVEGEKRLEFPKPAFGTSLKGVRPPRPISKDPRPMTSSSKRLSFSSVSSRRTIKYGAGKYADVELAPQPSEDPEDPLNWPMWRKNLNFLSLIHMVALVGVMKTIFIAVNSNIATNNGVSYTATVALTAVPLMVSAFSGMTSQIIARVFGKRPVYLASAAALFIGVVWSNNVMGSFAQNMAARVFQGLGWGAFDTLVLGSIQDTFFEHELGFRMMVLNVVSVATTWGAPLLGGLASASGSGFTLQFEILSFFLAAGICLIMFGAPETAFERLPYSANTPIPGRSQPSWAYGSFSREAAKVYISNMKPWSYKASMVDSNMLLQAPRAMIAPTTLLLFAVSLLPYATLWSFASSISLLFSVMPFMLLTQSIGALLTAPFIMASAVAAALAMPFFVKRFTPTFHVTTLAAATAVASIGTLGFGLYIQGCMTEPADSSSTSTSTIWELNSVGATLSFPAVSFLLGLIAAGSMAFDATIRPMIQRSTAFTSANLAVGLRNTADMHAGLTCLRNFFIGVFILGVPDAVFTWDGLKSASIGLGVTQMMVAAAAGYIWWMWEENVRRLDGRVMGLIDLSMLKQQGSFFDTT
ncbi:major facilitator superfamily transporter [Xylariales sp. AK1849]|nr:major facilitator superfamily transporter [Xylariales sp. AK1849]